RAEGVGEPARDRIQRKRAVFVVGDGADMRDAPAVDARQQHAGIPESPDGEPAHEGAVGAGGRVIEAARDRLPDRETHVLALPGGEHDLSAADDLDAVLRRRDRAGLLRPAGARTSLLAIAPGGDEHTVT